MPNTASVSPTGNKYIDGVLTGTKWATSDLTFSFPAQASYYGSGYGGGEPSNNFEAFSTAQQAAVRSILASYSAVANLAFSEVQETSSQHAVIRYAETDKYNTALGYYPSTSAAGGDTWFNNSHNYYDNPVRGNYGWMTIIHETGHALGLKHPQDSMNSFGTMPADHDSVEYTVMSYRSYIGAPIDYYRNGSWDFPQTLMMYDIAAVQKMYGANYTTNSGNSIYQWSPGTGEMFINGVGQGAPGSNKVFMTLWDGGGTDTYNFSAYTANLIVSLEPGEWTKLDSKQLANLGDGHYAAGNVANALMYQGNPASLIENAIGGSGNDTIKGNAADNILTGRGGNDIIDGRGGINTATYSGNASDYQYIHNADGSWGVIDVRTGSPDGADQLWSIKFLQFRDSTVDLGSSTSSQHPGFDPAYYLAMNPDVQAAGMDPYAHYIEYGWKEGRNPNAMFSTKDYLDANPDVAASGMNPLTHFEMFGWKEGRDPSPNFDVGLYLMHNPDVQAAGINPLDHYLAYGQTEGRTTYEAIGSPNAVGFDAEYYLFHNPDVAAAHMDPYQHYLAYGWKEGRDPNAYFDTDAYLAANPDVAACGMNPLLHYAQYGWKEGRDPSGQFDTSAYLAANPDVAAAGMNPLVHYEKYGIYEGRDCPGVDSGTGGTGGQAEHVDLFPTPAQNTVTPGSDALSGFKNVIGSTFNDTLVGTSGHNLLEGLGGNDRLAGAGGNDTFLFNANFGRTAIKDFAADANSAHHDMITLDHALFDAVIAATAQVVADIAGTIDAEHAVTLLNVHMGNLHRDDFTFV